jgi:hypothetical protein
MLFPRPIRSDNCSPQANHQLYIERVSEDPRIHSQDSLINLGTTIFNNAGQKNIIQPFGDTRLDLTNDFWDFKLINGLQSMKRGFFKMVKEPEIRDIAGVDTWAAYMLYNAGNNLNEHYLYYANVGTIVNRYAFCGNLITNEIVPMPGVAGKEQFLTSLLNKPFYVSRAEFVEDSQYGRMKEVLWFKLS